MIALTRAPADSRKAALVMLVLTSLYLLFELGFNARLLDVVGARATPDEVEHIEKFGRVISGVALTLLFWGKAIKRSLAEGGPTFPMRKLLLSATVCISAMFFGQRALIDFLVDHSSPETRARASVLVPISHLIPTSGFGLTAMDVPVAAFREPEGKTFIATFALQALAVPRLYDKLKGRADAIFRLSVENVRGTVDKSYDDYRDSVDVLHQRYHREYEPGVRLYEMELNGIPERQRGAWRDYTNQLVYRTFFGTKRIAPSRVPKSKWPEVRAKVRAQGVDVGPDWRPDDMAGFNQAIDRRVRREALAAFHEKSAKALGTPAGLEPGLSFEQWTAAPPIQKRWQESMHVPAGVRLAPDMTFADYGSRVYAPTVAAEVAQLKAERMAPPESYADGARYEQKGKDAARALIVPPIALTFSLLGAFTHILKCVLFAIKSFIVVPAPVIGAAVVLYLSAILVTPFSFPNEITKQKLVEVLGNQTTTAFGPIRGGMLNHASRWVMLMQKFFYPVNEAVRHTVLRGFTYGYYGAAEKPQEAGTPVPAAARPDNGECRLFGAGHMPRLSNVWQCLRRPDAAKPSSWFQ